LLVRLLERLGSEHVATSLVDLAQLPADALLGRGSAPEVLAALESLRAARIVVTSTPVYRATYSGLLKVFFDLLPPDAMIGKVGVPIATGAAPDHRLVIDHGLRPLFASLGAVVVGTGVYATDKEFANGVPDPALLERLSRAAAEAMTLASVRWS
jgi:FMN reductase